MVCCFTRDSYLASFPVPRPAFHCLQYRTASDEKLGVGLGMRLVITCIPAVEVFIELITVTSLVPRLSHARTKIERKGFLRTFSEATR